MLCFLENKISRSPIIAPDQKATTAPERILENPKSHPKPRESLASPKPIHAPRDKNHTRAKGKESKTPDANSKIVGI